MASAPRRSWPEKPLGAGAGFPGAGPHQACLVPSEGLRLQSFWVAAGAWWLNTEGDRKGQRGSLCIPVAKKSLKPQGQLAAF